MNDRTEVATPRYSPMGQLILARLREFYREPEAIFWVYGFPLLIVMALGIAFRNKPEERLTIDVEKVAEDRQAKVVDALKEDSHFVVQANDAADCARRLRTGKTDLVVTPLEDASGYRYEYDPTRSESRLARSRVNDVLQRAAGREDPKRVIPKENNEPGGRYIDFLVPGLLGMNLMGGGLWGVGFATVDLRLRKVLRRFLATPMKKTDFLAAILISRFLFLIPEMIAVLLFAWLVFGVVIQGSLVTFALLIVLGALTFAGLGLLVASRAKTLEAVSGLMNLVMLPMWVLSGIFFSSERFPEAAQPFIKALPLTPLIDAMRAVSLEGASLLSLWPQICILIAWGVVSFALALWWFRWN